MDSQERMKDEEEKVCSICGGAGYVRLDVPVNHPQFGKAVPCVCKRREIENKRLEELRKTSNLEQLEGMTFDTFKIDENGSPEVAFSLKDALETSREFAESPSGWLLLTGPYGCGKTHLAAAIATDRVKKGRPVLFVVVPDLLDHLRSTYAPNSPVAYDERFEQVRNVPVLILDDLGTHNATPWAAEKLYQILNYRYNAELPTVITTNQLLNDMDPRLASRLRDQSLVKRLPIYAADFRVQGRDETFGSLSLYGGMTFETFSTRRGEVEPQQSAHLQKVVRTMQEYAQHPQNWILLRGDYGVGKTHLAAAVANRVKQSGMTVLFVVVPDLLDHLRATFRPGSPVSYDQRFNEVRQAWLLVLDDMGVQNTTSWAQAKLFQLLNHRYVGGLPTVLTVSNEAWGKLDERLKSRLLDTSVCTILDIKVPTYRGEKKPERPRRSTRRRPE